MLNDLIQTLPRSHRTLAQDAAGLTAIVVMLLVGLHIPVLS